MYPNSTTPLPPPTRDETQHTRSRPSLSRPNNIQFCNLGNVPSIIFPPNSNKKCNPLPFSVRDCWVSTSSPFCLLDRGLLNCLVNTTALTTVVRNISHIISPPNTTKLLRCFCLVILVFSDNSWINRPIHLFPFLIILYLSDLSYYNCAALYIVDPSYFCSSHLFTAFLVLLVVFDTPYTYVSSASRPCISLQGDPYSMPLWSPLLSTACLATIVGRPVGGYMGATSRMSANCVEGKPMIYSYSFNLLRPPLKLLRKSFIVAIRYSESATTQLQQFIISKLSDNKVNPYTYTTLIILRNG